MPLKGRSSPQAKGPRGRRMSRMISLSEEEDEEDEAPKPEIIQEDRCYRMPTISTVMSTPAPAPKAATPAPNPDVLSTSMSAAQLEESSKTFAEQSAPSGGGMNVFGIGKDGLARAIIKFLTPPMPAPLTVCFQFPGAFLTHRYVVAMMKSLLMGKEGCGVVSVQYVDRNVALGTRNLENRWLITVTTQQAKDELITQGISIVNRKIAIRPYDEVLSEEYQEFQEFLDHQRKMGLKHSLDTRDNGGEGDPDVDNDGDMEGTLDRAVGGDGEPINSMKEVPLPPAHPVYNSDDSDKE